MDIKENIERWEYKDSLQEQALERMNIIKKNLGDKPTISIHFRRGDYLLPKYNHVYCKLDMDYYLQAITENFKSIKDYNFVVFS